MKERTLLQGMIVKIHWPLLEIFLFLTIWQNWHEAFQHRVVGWSYLVDTSANDTVFTRITKVVPPLYILYECVGVFFIACCIVLLQEVGTVSTKICQVKINNQNTKLRYLNVMVRVYFHF